MNFQWVYRRIKFEWGGFALLYTDIEHFNKRNLTKYKTFDAWIFVAVGGGGGAGGESQSSNGYQFEQGGGHRGHRGDDSAGRLRSQVQVRVVTRILSLRSTSVHFFLRLPWSFSTFISSHILLRLVSFSPMKHTFQLRVTTCDFAWLRVTTFDYVWLRVTTFDYVWLRLTTSNHV